ncbi:MAG: hypothetical protein AB7F09_06590 [Parvibaculaceae bacterium]
MKDAFFSRRVFLRKVAEHAPAAAALAVLPVAASAEPVAADPIKECERLAAELAKAMHVATPGNWRVTLDHGSGFVLICNDAWRAKEEDSRHIPADDMLPKYREVRELVDKLEWQGYEPRLVHGDLCITHPGNPQEPNRLLGQLRACEPELVAEYLTITGRITPAIP